MSTIFFTIFSSVLTRNTTANAPVVVAQSRHSQVCFAFLSTERERERERKEEEAQQKSVCVILQSAEEGDFLAMRFLFPFHKSQLRNLCITRKLELETLDCSR